MTLRDFCMKNSSFTIVYDWLDGLSSAQAWDLCKDPAWLVWLPLPALWAERLMCSFRAADLVCRKYMPIALEAAGLNEQAAALRALPEVADGVSAHNAEARIRALLEQQKEREARIEVERLRKTGKMYFEVFRIVEQQTELRFREAGEAEFSRALLPVARTAMCVCRESIRADEAVRTGRSARDSLACPSVSVNLALGAVNNAEETREELLDMCKNVITRDKFVVAARAAWIAA